MFDKVYVHEEITPYRCIELGMFDWATPVYMQDSNSL